jgi:hypothetical protein
MVSADSNTAASSTRSPRRPPAGAAAASSSSASSSQTLVTTRHLLQPTAHRRSRRLLCFILGLADIELQSIMHFLDRHELLIFARCSRRLHADADADFAWKRHAAFDVYLDSYRRSFDNPRLARSLLGHLHVHVHLWTHFAQGLYTLLSIQRFRCLTLLNHMSVPSFAPYLQHPTAFQGLQYLILGDSATLDLFSEAARAGRLPSLNEITSHDLHWPADEKWPTLRQEFRHLTSLRLHDPKLQE